MIWLKFTPLEFETYRVAHSLARTERTLKFTPLEFETYATLGKWFVSFWLKFTPLEFETTNSTTQAIKNAVVKIYSVGV